MTSGIVAASSRAAVKDSARLPVRVAYAALAWVVVFFAFHVYWFLGGSFGLSGELPSLVPDSVAGWIFEVLEAALWPLGAWVCVAIARGWPRGTMRRMALIVVWLGCAVLVVRGGAGLIDDLTRTVGSLPNGVTGLSHKQTMGAACYRSASALWSGNIIDAYFLAGGLLFGLLACRYRQAAIAEETSRELSRWGPGDQGPDSMGNHEWLVGELRGEQIRQGRVEICDCWRR